MLRLTYKTYVSLSLCWTVCNTLCIFCYTVDPRILDSHIDSVLNVSEIICGLSNFTYNRYNSLYTTDSVVINSNKFIYIVLDQIIFYLHRTFVEGNMFL